MSRAASPRSTAGWTYVGGSVRGERVSRHIHLVLVSFPVLLVVLFFALLAFKHRVLYAPSDFKDEENFFRHLPTATYAEKALQVEAEAKSDALETRTALETQPATRSYQEVYATAENLVFGALRHQFTGCVAKSRLVPES